MSASPGRIPFTVIGGFLGAGKTTLLQHWLRQAAGQRLAVLVNDFGAINLDAQQVVQAGAETMALSNGCVCCAIGDDLSLALLRVLDSQPPFDAVVVEASGVSDPWRIAQYALAEPRLVLQAVIVLVDLAARAQQAADPLLADTLVRQLQHADLVVLNKADLLPDTEAAVATAQARAWVAQHAPDAPVLVTLQAALPAGLLGAGLYRPHGGLLPLALAHDKRFEAWTVQPAGRFDPLRLRAWLRHLPPGVLRLKAVLPLTPAAPTGGATLASAGGGAASPAEEPGWFELQFAGRHGTLRRLTAAPATGAAVVAIGLAGVLPVRAIADGLLACAEHHPADPGHADRTPCARFPTTRNAAQG